MASYPWLRLLLTEPPTVSYTYCFEQLACRIHENADTYFPTVVLFLSNDPKGAYGQHLAPFLPSTRVMSSLLSLRHVNDAKYGFPILAAHGKLTVTRQAFSTGSSGHHNIACPNLNDLPISNLASFFYSRLVIPYVSTIVISAAEFQSITDLVLYLEQLGNEVPRTIPHSRPAVIVLAAKPGVDIKELESLSDESSLFSVVYVQHQSDALQRNLHHHLKRARQARLKERTLLSLSSLQDLWKISFQSFLQRDGSVTENMISALRSEFPVPTGLSSALADFISDSRSARLSEPKIYRLIASALTYDACSLTSHWFDSDLVFETLYKVHCLRALYGISASVETSLACDAIRTHFNLLYDVILTKAETAQSIRLNDMDCHKFLWKQLKHLRRTCLFCLQRKPEHRLPCNHFVCEICIRRLGVSTFESQYTLRMCPICSAKIDFNINLVPLTAGLRVLSIDGGGICGVIPLEFLTMFEEKLHDGLRVQDFFDLAIGTSAGGLILFSIFQQGQTAANSKILFEELNRKIFTAPQNIRHRLSSLWRLFVNDGYYSSSKLDEMLRQTYGNLTMSTRQSNAAQTVRLAVTTVGISDSRLVLITNYSSKHSDADYQVLSPSSSNIQTWKAARATTAAPTFFSATDLDDLGSFQDGGLRANNPSRLAIREAREIWGYEYPLDIIMSIGTGYYKRHDTPSFSRGFLLDSAIPRLVRHVKSCTDGSRTHLELLGSLSERLRPRYYRVDIPLPRPIALDKADEMTDLSRTVRDVRSGKDLDQFLLNVLASSFYLTSFRIRHMQQDYLRYTTEVACRLDASSVLRCITDNFGEVTLVRCERHLRGLKCDDVCANCHQLKPPIEDVVANFGERVEFRLKTQSGLISPISASGQRLAWFFRQQRSDRRLRVYQPRESCTSCSPTKRKRRLDGVSGRSAKRLRMDGRAESGNV